jgi:rod shape-determining protein MreD
LKTARFLATTLAGIAATIFFSASHVPLLSRVDWLLLAVAYQASAGDFVAATLGGAACGLAEDVLLFPIKGANAFAKALLGYLFTLLSLRLVFAGPLAVGAAIGVASAINDAIVALLGSLLQGLPFVFGGAGLLRAGLTGLCGGALFWAWRYPWREEWHRRSRRRLR